MGKNKILKIGFAVTLLMALVFAGAGYVWAQQAPKENIDALNQRIEEKKANIDHINSKIEAYKKEIEKKETQTDSLEAELELLKNRVEKTELEIDATNQEIESVNEEIDALNRDIRALEAELSTNREALKETLLRINSYDQFLTLEIIFGHDSFSDLFDQLQYLEDVNGDLRNALVNTQQAHEKLKLTQASYQGKQSRLQDLQGELTENKEQLEEKAGAQESLMAETQKSEAQYRTLLGELRQEQAYINHEIRRLQGEIEEKLEQHDDLGDSSLMSWPVDPGYRGISTYFHDPTYPFRHLFEHSGLDIPAAQGTPVVSAAPGYVAWTRTGRLYGNYVMIIHADGRATLYAHLSKISVSPDEFVARGEVIGLSGGMPGTAGAGLSTGPHLHFEVRKDGIPVNPMDYMIETSF